ncbi:hypothetical protein P3L10_007996 [Capsicum annuum]
MMLWYSTSGVLNIGFASILSYPCQENRTTISLTIISHVRDICFCISQLEFNLGKY